jgi:CBS domain containing-hemolysin-like protein
MLVTASAESGVVEQDEREMLHAIFDFGDLIARQVMIPRTEIEAVEADAPMEEIIKVATRSTYTKLPVFEDNLDQIVGIVHVKDILSMMQNPGCEQCTARELMREPIYVPETIAVSALLRQFRDNRQHIAIVMDEFGGTAGLVTLEDLLEEIVGEVSDPFDEFNPQILPQPDGSYLIDGMTLIEAVNEQLALNLSEPDYDTIAGYVLGKLGHMPRQHDTVEGDGVRLSVESLDGMRIAQVSLKKLPETSASNLPETHEGGS